MAAPSNRPPGSILHVDMDAFFAAVEQRDRPELRGKPVVVGAPADRRGVVCTASYEAREYGIHSAMPSRTAARLCPHAIFLPVDRARYQDASRRVMDVLREFTPLVEQISIDEAFLDVAGALSPWPSPRALAETLKQRILEATRLTASVGIAGNKFLAKLSSDLQKPDGLTEAPADAADIEAWLAPLPVTRIWGVGAASEKRLHRFGIRTIGDLQPYPQPHLERWFGPSFGAHLWRLARGLDDRPVITEHEARSISNEHTFGIDCDNPLVVRQRLIELTEHVGRRLRQADKRARTGIIKLRYADFHTLTRQQGLPRPTNADQDLLACALALFDREQVRRPVRLIGFGVSNLVEPGAAPLVQQDLFEREPEAPARRQGALDAAVDRIRARFGTRSLRRGAEGGAEGADEADGADEVDGRTD